eukprot:COSAG01_NODE_39_length_33243_cov_28.298558_15_plen_150_part_00
MFPLAHPPFSLIPRVLDKVRRERCSLTLIAPGVASACTQMEVAFNADDMVKYCLNNVDGTVVTQVIDNSDSDSDDSDDGDSEYDTMRQLFESQGLTVYNTENNDTSFSSHSCWLWLYAISCIWLVQACAAMGRFWLGREGGHTARLASP